MSISLTPLFSSSSGNSSLICSREANILVDVGVTGSLMEEAFEKLNKDLANVDGILVTHEHLDHIKGIGVISRRYNIPIYANAETWEAMSAKIGKISIHNQKIIDNNDFFIKDLCISPFELSHDAANPYGYTMENQDGKVSILTDTGKVNSKIYDYLDKSSVVILESNHDEQMLKEGPYPYSLKKRILSTKGHLSNNDAGKVALELYRHNVRNIILGHLSSHNNRKDLAKETVSLFFTGSGVDPETDLNIYVANRNTITGQFSIGK